MNNHEWGLRTTAEEARPKVGLLPLYIELYDQSLPEMRTQIDGFHATIIDELKKRGLAVVVAPVCRVKSEFALAVEQLEKECVDAIVTLHLAYSPSLESAEILAATKLPIIVLDTTPTYDFSPKQDKGEIFYNHGIHGVQDMCNLLIRNKKQFLLEAGHWEKSDVLARIAGCARAAKLAAAIKTARVGKLGASFEGMGDFAVPGEILRNTIGIETIELDLNTADLLVREVCHREIQEEMKLDHSLFKAEGLAGEVHRRSTISNLAIRQWLAKEELTAFTFNFRAISRSSAISTVPFLEASKAMARGIGYAGEGDVLTAALVGALLSVYPDTSFTEMFCPDWKNNSVFLSHMGEMNLDLAAERPILVEMDFPYTDAFNPAVAYGRFKAGSVVFVNLAPKSDREYVLIIAKGRMLGVDGIDNMQASIHGWFQPQSSIEEFLAKYSMAGGTHHAAIVYGDVCEEIRKFGELMGWEVVVIE